MSCVFCTDVAQSGEVVHESAHAWVVLHDDWAVPGHAMIVARRHVQNASDLTEHEWEHFSGVWRRAERAILAATGADRAIVMKLGIATPHLHVHIYPAMNGTSRDDVFAAIDAKTKAPRDEQLVATIRKLLTPSTH
ncbi:MAG TPA: HIT family protein [Thermoanaerobaculia bacterium]|nr:HIT family protein [Thermoanaerobaculia bacterium]